MLSQGRLSTIILAIAIPVLGLVAQVERPSVQKPLHFPFDADFHEKGMVRVKFVDGLTVRLRDGWPTDLGTGGLQQETHAILDRLRLGRWRNSYSVAEKELDSLRKNAEIRLNRGIADPNLCFHYLPSPDMETVSVIDLLNSLDCVEYCLPVYRTVHGTSVRQGPVPNFESTQTHLGDAPGGIGAATAWAISGSSGSGVEILDIDVGWNFSHNDLPFISLFGAPMNPLLQTLDPDHGTAVTGILGAISNGSGVTGIAPDATIHAAAASVAGNPFNVANAIVNSLVILGAGDIIDIEVAISVPGASSIPVEWDLPTYNAILLAVGNGITVVEAAGNGGNNLDALFFSIGNFGHHPFLAQNDSGAILVGAGASPVGSDVDRSRLYFSNHGETVDLQAHGEFVTSTGYGELFSLPGGNDDFTGLFGGTSSAAAIVSGAVAQLQDAAWMIKGAPLPPQSVRDYLRGTGSPQQPGFFPSTQNIGPRPDVVASTTALLSGLPVISGVSPNSFPQGLLDASLTVTGLNFTPGSTVHWGNTPLPTNFIDQKTLQATVAGTSLLATGTINLVVTDGGTMTSSSPFPMQVLPPFLGDAGNGLPVLTVNGSSGGTSRRVDIPLSSPWSLTIAQPTTNFAPSHFVLFGQVGVPDPATTFTFLPVIGSMSFIPCIAAPGVYPYFTLANTFGPDPCNTLLPATTAPWFVSLPGIPWPIIATLQGVIEVTPTLYSFTNGVIIRIG